MFKKKSSSASEEAAQIEQLPSPATSAQIEDKLREVIDKLNKTS